MPKPYYFLIFRRKWSKSKDFDGRYDSLKDNETVGIETWYNEHIFKIF